MFELPVRSKRSRSAKRTSFRLPGGRRSIAYRRRRKGMARCRVCGEVLHGTAFTRIHRVPGSGRAPSRPFGGNMCASCLKSLLRQRARGSA
ncbi:MAG: 50S ribosomal protein L34e [Candidatus Bathyarchaeia archaeon]